MNDNSAIVCVSVVLFFLAMYGVLPCICPCSSFFFYAFNFVRVNHFSEHVYHVRVPSSLVVKRFTRNPGVLDSSRTRSSWFFSWECPWARHFRAKPTTSKTRKDMNNVSCRRDMTEMLLKAA